MEPDNLTVSINLTDEEKETFKKSWKKGETGHIMRTYTSTQPTAELINLLREMRIQKKITQTEVAKKMGTTKGNVSRIETHAHSPRLDTLLRYTRAMGIELLVTHLTDY